MGSDDNIGVGEKEYIYETTEREKNGSNWQILDFPVSIMAIH